MMRAIALTLLTLLLPSAIAGAFYVPPGTGGSTHRHLGVHLTYSYLLGVVHLGIWEGYLDVVAKARLSILYDGGEVTVFENVKTSGLASGEEAWDHVFPNVGGSTFRLRGLSQCLMSYGDLPIANATAKGVFNESAYLRAEAHMYVLEEEAYLLYGYAEASADDTTIWALPPSWELRELATDLRRSLSSEVKGIAVSNMSIELIYAYSNISLVDLIYEYTRILQVEIVDGEGNLLPARITLYNASDLDGDLHPESNVILNNEEPYAEYVWPIGARRLPRAPQGIGEYVVEAESEITISDKTYVFDHWECQGGVQVANSSSPRTNATVSDDGILRAVYRYVVPPPRPGELLVIVYDLVTSKLWTAEIMINGSSYVIHGNTTVSCSIGKGFPVEFVSAPNRTFAAWSSNDLVLLTNPLASTTSAVLLSSARNGVLILTLRNMMYELLVDSRPPSNVGIEVEEDSGSEVYYTPFRIRRKSPFEVTLKIPTKVKRDKRTLKLKYCLLSDDRGRILANWSADELPRKKNKVIVELTIDGSYNLTAFYGLKGKKGLLIEIEDVSLVPCYCDNSSSVILDNTYLAPMEYMCFKVLVASQLKRTTEPGIRPANLTVEVLTPTFARIVSGYTGTLTKEVGREGNGIVLGTIGLWAINGDALGGDVYVGKVTYSYSWDEGGGSGSTYVTISSMKPNLLWLPISPDSYALAVYYTWADDTPVIGRPYISGWLTTPYGDITLKGDLIAGLRAFTNVTLPPDFRYPWNTSVAFSVISHRDLAGVALSDFIPFHTGFPWISSLSFEKHMLGVIIEERNDSLFNLSLVDLSELKRVKGIIALIIKDLDEGTETYRLLPTNDEGWLVIERSELQLPRRYEVWAIGLATGYNVIYESGEYAKILIERSG
ncbi:MAG: hypothetical protein J7L11_07605 [Thermoprotei archaeon]|nr:hypothetical protein [Thermoprotei archaeon]